MNFDVEKIKTKMLVKYPFFGSVVTNVNYIETNHIKIAATDGKTIYYNNEFMSNISIDEQIFIMAHEVCHIAFNHILRSEGKDEDTWNIARDAVINAFLKQDGLKMTQGGVDIADAINYDAEKLYEKLLNEKQNNQSNSSQSNNGKNNNSSTSNLSNSNNGENNNSSSASASNSNNEGNKQQDKDVGHDTHSMWKDAVKKLKEEQEEEKNKNKSSELQEQDKQGEKNGQNEVKNKQKEAEQLGEKESFKKNHNEKKRKLKELKETLSKKSLNHGNSTNESIRNISNIGISKPIIDWRYILKEAINYDVDWSYKNSIIEDGVIRANLEEQMVPETEIVLDTSGSINDNLLKNFLKECKNILQHSKLKVGCFDTKFYGFNEIRTEKDIENMKFVGGGGTDFNIAVNAFSRRVENKIIFTDGQALMPNMVLDAIWIVFGTTKINPKGGKVIYIDDEQLKRLSYSELSTNENKRIR